VAEISKNSINVNRLKNRVQILMQENNNKKKQLSSKKSLLFIFNDRKKSVLDAHLSINCQD
jgi:hypothetical protein